MDNEKLNRCLQLGIKKTLRNYFIFLDKYGWPLVLEKGKWIKNLIRILIHGRKIMRTSTWVKLEVERIIRDQREGTSSEKSDSI